MKVKIVNLEKRKDRWESIQDECKKFGITDYERFNAFNGGYLGFNKSMHFVLENEQECLVLEDDCELSGNIGQLENIKMQLPDDWDLLYLGANVLSPQQRHSKNLWRLTEAWTSHAILYSTKGADYCFKHFPWEDGIIYDEWLRTVAQKVLKCYIVRPFMAIQKDGESDIFGGFQSYGLKATEKYLT